MDRVTGPLLALGSWIWRCAGKGLNGMRPFLPDFRDAHVYGGAALVTWGVTATWGWPAGAMVAGAALLYLGIRGV